MTLTNDGDFELYLKIRAGDLAAYECLYARYRSPLFVYLRQLLRSGEDAEEVFHETFLEILRADFARENSDAPGAFRGWIFRVARNRALNRLRARTRAQANAPEPSAVSAGSEALATSPETRLDESERNAEIRAAVLRLPDHLGEVFRLHQAGLPHGEIGRTLGIPVGTVKSRFHALIQFLRQEIRS